MTTFCAVPTAVAFTITRLLLSLLLLLICPLLFLLLVLLLLLPLMPVLALVLVLFAIVLVELLLLRLLLFLLQLKITVTFDYCYSYGYNLYTVIYCQAFPFSSSPFPTHLSHLKIHTVSSLCSRSWIPTLTAILLEVGGSSTPRNASKKDRGERLSTNSVFYSLKGVVIHAYWYTGSAILYCLVWKITNLKECETMQNKTQQKTNNQKIK